MASSAFKSARKLNSLSTGAAWDLVSGPVARALDTSGDNVNKVKLGAPGLLFQPEPFFFYLSSIVLHLRYYSLTKGFPAALITATK